MSTNHDDRETLKERDSQGVPVSLYFHRHLTHTQSSFYSMQNIELDDEKNSIVANGIMYVDHHSNAGVYLLMILAATDLIMKNIRVAHQSHKLTGLDAALASQML